MFSVFVSGTPRPQGSKQAFRRGSKIVLVEASKGLPTWRQAIVDKIKDEEPDVITGAVDVKINFYLIKPKTVKRQFMTVAPDIDKLCRAVLDALTISGLIEDDANVIELHATKSYAKNEGAFISVLPHTES